MSTGKPTKNSNNLNVDNIAKKKQNKLPIWLKTFIILSILALLIGLIIQNIIQSFVVIAFLIGSPVYLIIVILSLIKKRKVKASLICFVVCLLSISMFPFIASNNDIAGKVNDDILKTEVNETKNLLEKIDIQDESENEPINKNTTDNNTEALTETAKDINETVETAASTTQKQETTKVIETTQISETTISPDTTKEEPIIIIKPETTKSSDTTKEEPVIIKTPETAEKPVEPAIPSSFVIHFIDVGQADAALILCDGKSMLIDGGNAGDSDLIYTYLKKLNITYLDYIVATHAHEDHVGGLSAPLNTNTVGKVYAPETQADTKAYLNFLLGVQKQNLTITTPIAGDKINLGSSTITFLAPITENYDDINNTSIVLRIIYGNTSFLFTGDAARESEADIIAVGYTLESTVLKIGHHGGETSTSYVFLREVMPQYAIISVGKDNSYGHPTEEVLSRLRDADVKLFRTDMQGDIIATSNGKIVTFTTQKNQTIETNPTIQETTVTPETTKTPETEPETKAETIKAPIGYYIGNLNTQKFHLPSCGSLPLEKNRIYFDNRQEAVDNGYVPCKICKP